MIVEVRLFAGLQKYVRDAVSGEPFSVTLDDHAAVADLLECLAIPRREAYVNMVNGHASSAATILQHADRVGIFPPVGGG